MVLFDRPPRRHRARDFSHQSHHRLIERTHGQVCNAKLFNVVRPSFWGCFHWLFLSIKLLGDLLAKVAEDFAAMVGKDRGSGGTALN